jgi:hypothetical protein
MYWVAWPLAVLAVVTGFRIWWQRQIRSQILDPLLPLFDATPPTRGAYGSGAWIIGFRHARALRLGLFDRGGEGGARWIAMADPACDSTAVFDLGGLDGHESYVAQVSDPTLLAAVHRMVETYSIQSAALNASAPPLPAPYRLRVILSQRVRRPSPPVATA